jgi:hypothetical protein
VRYQTALDAVVQTGGFLITLGVNGARAGPEKYRRACTLPYTLPLACHSTGAGELGTRSSQAHIFFQVHVWWFPVFMATTSTLGRVPAFAGVFAGSDEAWDMIRSLGF